MDARKLKDVGETTNMYISTQSMFKPYGLAMWNDEMPIEMVSKALNYSLLKVNMDHLGTTREELFNN